MGQVTLVGYLDVPTDRLAGIRAALPEHIRLTKAEPDCISFDVTESTTHPGRFDVAEVFASEKGYTDHRERTARSSWAEIAKDIPRNYTLSGMKP